MRGVWLIVPLLSLAQAEAQVPALGEMAGTAHDLSLHGRPDREICLACHTPIGDPLVAEPAWQRTGVLARRGFRTMDVLALGGTIGAPGELSANPSLACLSCHDAAQADAIPGIGARAESTVAGMHAHPVGVEYALGRFVAGRQPQFWPADPAVFALTLRPREEFNAPQRAVIDGNPVWWLGEHSARRKNDIRLFSRVAADGELAPFIECASCHDPHSAEIAMMRRDNIGSSLCLACHAL